MTGPLLPGQARSGPARPGDDVLRPLRHICRRVMTDRAGLDRRYLAALADLLPPPHPLRRTPAAALDCLDAVLAAVLDEGSAESAEARALVCGERCALAGVDDAAYPAAVRAVTRAVREGVGELWDSSLSSGWAAVHVWLVAQLLAGAVRARSRGTAWSSFPELAPPGVGASGAPPTGATGATGPSGVTGDAGALTVGAVEDEWAALERAAGRRPALDPPA